MDDPFYALWDGLRENIEHFMDHVSQGINYQKYMRLYTDVYNYCTGATHNTFDSKRDTTQLIGGKMYNELKQFLERRLEGIYENSKKHSDENLLRYYSDQWHDYTMAMKTINHIFEYLNRNWIKREVSEGRTYIYDVYNLSLIIWKEKVFTNMKDLLIACLLQLIERQRHGEQIPEDLVKNVIESYTLLGEEKVDDINSRNPDVPRGASSFKIYEVYYEKPFIEATEKFYLYESQKFISENSIVDYMKKAKARLEEENQRVDRYLNESSRIPLLKACKDVLIKNHLEPIQDEFTELLQQDRVEDLELLYFLLKYIPNSFDPLCQKFEDYVKQQGLASIEKVAQNPVSKSGSSTPVSAKKEAKESVNPQAYAEAILVVRKKYIKLINDSFDNDSKFVASMDKACREFINKNKICNQKVKSPELLARYCDGLLKKSNKIAESSEIEERLKDIITIFQYIEDKDVFQKFYSKMLAKRLVVGTSASEDLEESMISKLKEICGSEYTLKLQKMFQDMNISKDLNENYNNFKSKNEISSSSQDFYIMVLSTNCWPLHPPTSPFTVPSELEKQIKSFQVFYQKNHSGRKLTWLFHLCKGELKTRFYDKNYIFQVSVYQMAILLSYNKGDSYTLKELQELTGLNQDVILGQLNILCKAKVFLLKSSPSGDKTYVYNPNFKFKKIRVPLNMTVRSEQQAENEETRKAIENDRSFLIQAAIVRIMKTRKTLKHVALMDEVISQLKNRFKPSVPDIKKNIDYLLDKEYIERREGEKDTYNYLA